MAQSSFFGQSILDYNAVADKFENFNYDYTAMANKPCINGHKLLGGENTLQYLGITDFVTGCVTGVCERTAALEAVTTEHAQCLDALAECVNTKSTVTTSSTGTSTEVINYITVDGCEKLLPGGAAGVVNTVNNKGPVSGNVTVTGSDIAVGESCATLICDKIDAIDVSTTSLSNAVDNLSTSVESLATAVSGKSTVSVSSIGSATDEVCYITINGTEHKLAGGGSPGPGPSPSGDIDVFTYTTQYSSEAYPDCYDVEALFCNALSCYIANCVHVADTCHLAKNAIINIDVCQSGVAQEHSVCFAKTATLFGTVQASNIQDYKIEDCACIWMSVTRTIMLTYNLPIKLNGCEYPTLLKQSQKVCYVKQRICSWAEPYNISLSEFASLVECAFECPEGFFSGCSLDYLINFQQQCSLDTGDDIELYTMLEVCNDTRNLTDGTYNVKVVKSGNEFCTCLVKEE